MSKVVRFGVIDYINLYPFLGHFLKNPPEDIEIIKGVPVHLNQMMLADALDVSFMSSSAYLANKERYDLIGPYGIVGYGDLGSVNLYTQKNLKELDKAPIVISDQTATSVRLLHIMARYFWKVTPDFIFDAKAEKKPTSLLLIGDDALRQEKIEGYQTVDLCASWGLFTGLPFVFGVLAARKELSFSQKKQCEHLLHSLTHSYHASWQERPALIQKASRMLNLCETRIATYFSTLSYQLNTQALQGLHLFEHYLSKEALPL